MPKSEFRTNPCRFCSMFTRGATRGGRPGARPPLAPERGGRAPPPAE